MVFSLRSFSGGGVRLKDSCGYTFHTREDSKRSTNKDRDRMSWEEDSTNKKKEKKSVCMFRVLLCLSLSLSIGEDFRRSGKRNATEKDAKRGREHERRTKRRRFFSLRFLLVGYIASSVGSKSIYKKEFGNNSRDPALFWKSFIHPREHPIH